MKRQLSTGSQKVINKFEVKNFLAALNKEQKQVLPSIISSSGPSSLRKLVYISSGGAFAKYADHLRVFVYNEQYVPIHPIETLGYYLSSEAHNDNKKEIIKDCFSLINACDELWVFEEELPSEISDKGQELAKFPEGVLAEIYYWMVHKPNAPIKFFTFAQAGIKKYDPNSNWALISNADENKANFDEEAQTVSIIDLGSSTVKLTVFNLKDKNTAHTLQKKSITVNLAEGYFENKVLQTRGIERTIQAIRTLVDEALSYGSVAISIVATGVMREAKNADEFITHLKQETGITMEVISGEEEAELIFKAVESSFVQQPESLIVINAGGGSTEVIISEKNDLRVFSVPVGISDLNEKFLHEYPVKSSMIENMKDYITKILKEEIAYKIKSKTTFVYTGGELDYMMITGFPLEDYHYSYTHPKKISITAFKNYAKDMSQLSLEKLQAYMPSNPKWMNGAVASNTLLEAIAEYFGASEILPSNKNLNDGIILTKLQK